MNIQHFFKSFKIIQNSLKNTAISFKLFNTELNE